MSSFTPPTIEELQGKFPQYAVESFIAQGGMGAVFLARQRSLDRPVAIKILPKEFGQDQDYRISFETEAKAMAKLNHNNLVGIYDFGDIDGMLYIIMEFVPGRSLFDTAHGQAVNELEAAALILEMCHGLDHAHKAGMLHRDIKPANVLIDDEARPKIVDFGLARPVGETQTEGVVFGTPGYTAPEVISNPYSVDQRSDIFSVGVMLYELLTGSLPETPIIPASRKNKTDSRFDTIITKAIHPNPAMRYNTAGDMAKALEELIANFETTKPGAIVAPTVASGLAASAARAPISTPRPVVQKSGSNAGVLVGVLLIGIVIVAVFIANSGKDDTPTGPTPEELAEKQRLEDAEKRRIQELEREQERQAQLERERKEREAIAKREKEQKELEARLAEERKKKQEAEEERKRLEQELKDKKAQELAALEAEKNKQNEIPEFDHESFIDTLRTKLIKSSKSTVSRIEKDIEKRFDRLERSILRTVKQRVPGRRGREASRLAQRYIDNWRETGKQPALPRGTPNEVKEDIAEYEEDVEEIKEKHIKTLNRNRNDYTKALTTQITELEKIGDKDAVQILKDELTEFNKNEYFMEVITEKDPSASKSN